MELRVYPLKLFIKALTTIDFPFIYKKITTINIEICV